MIRINRFVIAAPRVLALLAAGVVLVGMGSGCGSKATSLNVPMTWKSTERLDMASMAGWTPQASVFVAPVTDKRPANQREKIGENTEDADDGVIKPIYPGGEVTEFVRDAIKTQFQQAGINVVEDQASADRVIATEVLYFWVEETGTYKGEVRGTVAVNNKAGQQLWKGTVNGTASKWGRSMSADNYREVFSDSTLEMIENALKNPSFRKALDSNAAAAAPAQPNPLAQPAAPAPGALTTPPPPPPPANDRPAPATPTPGATGGNPLARPAPTELVPAPGENN